MIHENISLYKLNMDLLYGTKADDLVREYIKQADVYEIGFYLEKYTIDFIRELCLVHKFNIMEDFCCRYSDYVYSCNTLGLNPYSFKDFLNVNYSHLKEFWKNNVNG